MESFAISLYNFNSQNMNSIKERLKLLREKAIKEKNKKMISDVHELIFQHLSKADIIKLSEVSPKWNFMISNSSVAMSKVCLKLSHGAFVCDEALKSQRHYNNLELVISDDAFFEIYRKLQFLEKISPWLKHLKIKVFAAFLGLQAMPLPQLETLEIFSFCMPFIFTKVNTLKKLTIETPFYNREAVEWIQKQSELNELKLQGFNNFFHFNPVAPKGVEKLTLLGKWNGADQGFSTCRNCARTKFRVLCGTKLSTCANFVILCGTKSSTCAKSKFRAVRNYARA
jgi:hypothetical protein